MLTLFITEIILIISKVSINDVSKDAQMIMLIIGVASDLRIIASLLTER